MTLLVDKTLLLTRPDSLDFTNSSVKKLSSVLATSLKKYLDKRGKINAICRSGTRTLYQKNRDMGRNLIIKLSFWRHQSFRRNINFIRTGFLQSNHRFMQRGNWPKLTNKKCKKRRRGATHFLKNFLVQIKKNLLLSQGGNKTF